MELTANYMLAEVTDEKGNIGVCVLDCGKNNKYIRKPRGVVSVIRLKSGEHKVLLILGEDEKSEIIFCKSKRKECLEEICGLLNDDETWQTCKDRIKMVSIDG